MRPDSAFCRMSMLSLAGLFYLAACGQETDHSGEASPAAIEEPVDTRFGGTVTGHRRR